MAVRCSAQPSAVALISDYAAERLQGRVYGWTNLTGFGVGSFAGIVGGVVADDYRQIFRAQFVKVRGHRVEVIPPWTIFICGPKKTFCVGKSRRVSAPGGATPR